MALLARYKLDETTGTTASDSVGTVNGTITGGVTLDKDGIEGRSFAFDGVDGQIDMGNNFAFDRTDSFSLSCWFKTTSVLNSRMLSKRESSGDFRGYVLRTLAAGTVELSMRNSAGNNLSVSTTNTFNDGAWHHVIATYDGSSTGAGVTIYVDGVSQTLSITDDTLSATILSSDNFTVSHSSDGVFNGSIDDVRIYNSELTAAEVANLYNSYSLIDPNNAISIEWVKQAVVGTPGSGNVSLGAAEAGFIAFQDDERVVNDAVLHYVIEDGINRERGVGLFTSSGSILARSNILAKLDAGVLTKNPTVGLDLSSSAIVFTAAIAQ